MVSTVGRALDPGALPPGRGPGQRAGEAGQPGADHDDVGGGSGHGAHVNSLWVAWSGRPVRCRDCEVAERGAGVVVGGLILGLSAQFAGRYLPKLTHGFLCTGFKDTPGFLLLIIILLVRPAGLFGRRAVRKV